MQGRRDVRDQSKDKDDFDQSPIHSHPWGDRVEVTQTAHGELFGTFSHNPNGLSSRDDNLDMEQFAAALQAKEVALVSVYEVNRNLEELQSLHSHLRAASTHYKGISSSAKLGWTSKYQPGGTAVFVPNQWATRFLFSGSDSLGRWSWITLMGKDIIGYARARLSGQARQAQSALNKNGCTRRAGNRT
jgi:hypothetical protein